METYCSKVCSCGEDMDAALEAGLKAKAAVDALVGTVVRSVNGETPDENGNVTIEATNGGECNIHRIESLDESNLVNLRDLDSGQYILYGYFSPYANSDIAISADNSMVSVIRKDAGSHVICLDPLNAKIVFFEMLEDETEPNGIKYTRTVIPVLELGNVKTVNGVAPDEDGNVDLTGYATEQWVQEGFQPKGEYLTEHQDISGKLDASELPTAINTALAQAKASGDFDGADGYTPVRGKDYYTEADKVEMVAMVIESLGGNPIFGIVDENNNIIVNGNLPDGTYSVKYEMENGNKVNIGNLVLDTNVYYTVTNTLTQCTSNNSATKAVQGGSYSATITAKSGYEMSSIKVTMGGSDISSSAVSGGNISIANVTGNIVVTAVATEIVVTPTYTNLFDPSKAQINKRVSNSFELKDGAGHVTTEFIDIQGKTPFTNSTKFYVKGANFNATSSGSAQARIITYKTIPSTPYSGGYSVITANSMTQTDEGNGVISVSDVASSFIEGIKYMVLTLKVSDSTITAADIQNIVVTIDEPIV